MRIKNILLKNVKNIKKANIELKNNISGFYGPNGTGKTAVVEALDLFCSYFQIRKIKDENEKRKLEMEMEIKLRNKLRKLFKINEKEMSIETVFESDRHYYKLLVVFYRGNPKTDEIFVKKEEFSLKKIEPKSEYVVLFNVNRSRGNTIPDIPQKKNENKEKGILDQLMKHDDYILSKSFFTLTSYLNLMFEQIEEGNIKNQKSFEKDEEFYKHFSKISNIINYVNIIGLEDQVIVDSKQGVPMNIRVDNSHGKILLKNGNYYSEIFVSIIEKVISQISEMFSIIIPELEIILKKGDKRTVMGGIEIELGFFIKKNGQEVAIEDESTGIIKLLSILSSLIDVIKNSDAIVIIDELDAHIFEYLLGLILQKMSEHKAKGQLIFTAHNLYLLERLNKDSIIITTMENANPKYVYLKGVLKTTNLRQKYLKSQAMWSEDNISALGINKFDLDLFMEELVM